MPRCSSWCVRLSCCAFAAAALLVWEELRTGERGAQVLLRVTTSPSWQMHSPPEPAARQPVLAPTALEEPTGRPPKSWMPRRPDAAERGAADPAPSGGEKQPPVEAPTPSVAVSQRLRQPAAAGGGAAAPSSSRSDGGGGGGGGGNSRASPLLAGLRPLQPKVYTDHLDYMDKHPHNGKAGSMSDWTKGIGGYHRPEASTRAAELLAIMFQSGWRDADTPLGLEGAGAPRGGPPVLTGNAWHFGRGRCPAACAANGGVCLPAVGRCDCPRHRWGPVCELLVQPAVARPERFHGWCVYNDSNPWMCDKPVCTRAHPSSATLEGRRERCVGSKPVEDCPGGCGGRGICRGGRCACYPHWSGSRCEKQVRVYCVSDCLGRGECDTGWCRCKPPYYGVDCSLAPPPPAPPSAPPLPVGHLGEALGAAVPCVPPCIYVYELPPRFNVLALKAEPHYPLWAHGPADYRAFTALHVALLRSRHRTTDPAAAAAFYVPLWDFHGSWGNPEVYWRAAKYVVGHFPFWNASGGADHIFVNTRDAGGCSNPWGSIHAETASAMVFSNWGGVTGLGGVPVERCFDARQDLVLPGVLKGRIAERSPFLRLYEHAARRGGAPPPANATARLLLPGAAAPPTGAVRAAALAAAQTPSLWAGRGTLLFFHGSLCWQTYDRVRDQKALARKCKQKHGFLDSYSFGVRYEVYKRFHDTPRVQLRATDLIPGPPGADLDELTLRSVFCLCPSGTGWGMRAFHAVALGCIPVIVQDDGSARYPSVLQAFEGLLLDWSAFSVRLRFADLPQLPAILRKIEADPVQMQAKRAGLAAVFPRLLWRVALPQAARAALRGVPDAFDSVMQSLLLRQRYGLRGGQGLPPRRGAGVTRRV